MEKKYIYFISEPPHNVVKSQVIEYAEMLAGKGLKFDFIFSVSLSEFRKGKNSFANTRLLIKEKVGSKVTIFPGYRKKNYFGVYLSAFLLFFILLRYRKYKLILHSRGGFSSNVLSKLKILLGNMSYLFDVRGDSEAEFKFIAQRSNMTPEKLERLLSKYSSDESYISHKATHLFTVSEILKERLITRWNLQSEKITVIPCVADKNKFYFDKSIREDFRSRLGINDKFVFIYAGGIGIWHYSEETFKLMSFLMANLNKLHFIILTPAITDGEKLAEKYLPSKSYHILKAERKDVPNYMMASDMGILLRERDPLNEVASPTKFAEYLMTGLRVLISDYIGDYSDFVRKNNLGIVTPDNSGESILPQLEEIIKDNNLAQRDRIAQLGRENFAKDKYINIMEQVYRNYLN